jgi:hypothetical protein
LGDSVNTIKETRKMQRKLLVGKPEGTKPNAKYGRRWEDNITLILSKHGVNMWTGFIWPVNIVMNIWVSITSREFLV